MTKKISLLMLLFIILISSTVIRAEEFQYAEIFDPRQNKVVKEVQMNSEIQNIVVCSIKGVNRLYGKSNPVNDDGYAIRIPLDPAVNTHGKWLNTVISEVYIIIPKSDPPFFLIFEDIDKLSCFPFNGDIDDLSKALNFNLKVK
ncbi:hypothetical protein [Clostridium sp.]|uniref:hypothetical protein n=1 Tax=Clostridium sp. TaxID=1506 RepID=UPI001A46B6B0|nr:hypothetical protein [Clostridium sp.]MBK5241859.1 hypothetical protein [Clostridium sp.]